MPGPEATEPSRRRQHLEVGGELHEIIGDVDVECEVTIAYDPDAEAFRFIYFADSQDPTVPDPSDILSADELRNSLTLALVRHGKPLRGPSVELRQILGPPPQKEEMSA